MEIFQMLKMRPRHAVFQFPFLRQPQRAAAIRKMQSLADLNYVTERTHMISSVMLMVGFPEDFTFDHVYNSTDFGDLREA